jgi:hypothetical protein
MSEFLLAAVRIGHAPAGIADRRRAQKLKFGKGCRSDIAFDDTTTRPVVSGLERELT